MQTTFNNIKKEITQPTVYGGSKAAALVARGEHKAQGIKIFFSFCFDGRRIGETQLIKIKFTLCEGTSKVPLRLFFASFLQAGRKEVPRGISVCEGGMLRNDGYKKNHPKGYFS